MDNNARWDPQVTEIFLNLCITQINLGKRQGRSFTKQAWDNIVATFQQRTGRQYDKKKLKNKHDSLRGELKAWLDIMEESGVGWDPDLGTVTAPKAWWKQAGKKNKYYPRFRHEALQFEDELRFIFKDVLDDVGIELSPGILQRLIAEDVYRPTMGEDVRPEADMEEGFGDSEDDQFDHTVGVSTGLTDEMAGAGISSTSGRSSQGKRKMEEASSSSKRKKTSVSVEMASALSRMADTLEKREKRQDALEECSLPVVIDQLCEIAECCADLAFHIGCIELLQKQSARVTFAHLNKKGPRELLLGWLRMAVSKNSS